jgi:hypothetical protein
MRWSSIITLDGDDEETTPGDPLSAGEVTA